MAAPNRRCSSSAATPRSSNPSAAAPSPAVESADAVSLKSRQGTVRCCASRRAMASRPNAAAIAAGPCLRALMASVAVAATTSPSSARRPSRASSRSQAEARVFSPSTPPQALNRVCAMASARLCLSLSLRGSSRPATSALTENAACLRSTRSSNTSISPRSSKRASEPSSSAASLSATLDGTGRSNRVSLRSAACPALPARSRSASSARFSRKARTSASDGRFPCLSQASISSRTFLARSTGTAADSTTLRPIRS